MTNQLQGEILFAGWEGGAAESGWAHTPWMAVRGDFATFGVQVLVSTGATLTWEVQTRKADDPAVTTLASAAGSVAAPVLSSAPATSKAINTAAAQQLVRYRFNTGGTPSTSSFVVFRALQPSWQVER